MTTWSSFFLEPWRRYSNRPHLANRRTNTWVSLSMFRPPDLKEASGKPLRRSCAQAAAAALNVPKSTEWPPKHARMCPLACASSETWPLSRTEIVGGAARRPFFVPGTREPAVTLRYGDEVD